MAGKDQYEPRFYMNVSENILVTGGAGYIGSHTALDLLKSGYQVVVIDNLCNSSQEPLKRIQDIAKRKITFVEGDVRDRSLLDGVFSEYNISAVFHFAALKAVGESVEQPVRYYDNNVNGALVLLQAMSEANVFRFVFSSSACVYGEQECIPYRESDPTGKPTSPYGRSKLIIEEVLQDLCSVDPRWHVALLRYFNPVGAHESGLIGEDPHGIPSNLVPYISQVAAGKREFLSVYGQDYPTPDGTGVRDYIHVMDLAAGHLAALDRIKKSSGVKVWNLGTGKGYSVLEMIDAFEKASGRKIPFKIAARRPGDVAINYADPAKAKEELGWQAKRGIYQMMVDTWRWQGFNPEGYK